MQLKKTKFKTVFANDILNDARNAWVNYFLKKGRDAELFHLIYLFFEELILF